MLQCIDNNGVACIRCLPAREGSVAVISRLKAPLSWLCPANFCVVSMTCTQEPAQSAPVLQSCLGAMLFGSRSIPNLARYIILHTKPAPKEMSSMFPDGPATHTTRGVHRQNQSDWGLTRAERALQRLAMWDLCDASQCIRVTSRD